MEPPPLAGLLKISRKNTSDFPRTGLRVLAIPSKDIPPRGIVAGDATPYTKADLLLKGYVAFVDPPKDSATAAIKALQGHGIRIMVVTGDNEIVAKKICREVGLATDFALLGSAGRRSTFRIVS